MTKIDQWEKESIVRIQQRANDLRAEFFERMAIESETLSAKIRQISEQLIESREIDNFVEKDLLQWTSCQNDLKANLYSPSIFSFDPLDERTLVKNVSTVRTIEIESLERVFDETVTIASGGHVANRGTTYGYTEIRGTN